MSADVWFGGAGDWSDDADWSDGAPNASSEVEIDTGSVSISASFGVASLSNKATLFAADIGASVISGDFQNQGALFMDTADGDGGSSLAIGGALENVGYIQVGSYDGSLTDPDQLSAGSLDNQGAIFLNGAAGATGRSEQTLLDIHSRVSFGGNAGVLIGDVSLNGDAALEFSTGKLNIIASGAALTLEGPGAVIEDAGALGSNSALLGLRTNSGILTIDDGVQITTFHYFANTDLLQVDVNRSQGGSGVTVAKLLNNSGTMEIGNSDDTLTSNVVVSAGALVNSGAITLAGGDGSSGAEAILFVNGPAELGTQGGYVSGDVSLSGNSNIVFRTGQISVVSYGSSLTIDGAQAFVADSGADWSNSALHGLADVAGAVALEDGAAVSVWNGLVVTGQFGVSDDDASGGSSLAVGGALVVAGSLTLGNASMESGASVRASSLDDAGGNITLVGSSTGAATMTISGAALVEGEINIGAEAAVHIRGALTGVGSVSLADGASLSVGGGGGGGEQIDFLGPNATLDVTSGSAFTDALSGFGSGDSIEFSSVRYRASEKIAYSSGAGGGVVSIESSLGATLAQFSVVGVYAASDFTLSAAGHSLVIAHV